MSFTGNLGVTHGGIFIAYSRGGEPHLTTGQVKGNSAKILSLISAS
jgi:hypothetical protein